MTTKSNTARWEMPVSNVPPCKLRCSDPGNTIEICKLVVCRNIKNLTIPVNKAKIVD